MKTYILSTLDRIKKYSKTLDAKAILYNKNWEVFNETGEKEVLIFRPKNELLIVRQGIVQRGKWELLPTGSLLIETDATTYMFDVAFVDNNFLALQLDGTKECMLMIEAESMKKKLLVSIDKVEKYLEDQYIPNGNVIEEDYAADPPAIVTFIKVVVFFVFPLLLLIGMADQCQ